MKLTHHIHLECKKWLRLVPALAMALAGNGLARAQTFPAPAAEPIDIGSRRELFVDDYLLDRMTGGAGLRLHHPVPAEIVMTFDAPWEGSGCGFHSIFKDGNIYRLYYKAWNIVLPPKAGIGGRASESMCYAESDDGIHWRKPKLGLHEFKGSKDNNIVIPAENLGKMRISAAEPSVFKDENPAVSPDAKYKAFIATHRPNGAIPYKSPDGIHWTRMTDKPVITDGAFDSQNTAFWDTERSEYRAYWRYFERGDNKGGTRNPRGIRAIRTATSPDMLTWTKGVDLTYPGSYEQALYTNVIKPYHRAPHLFLGFPVRYVDRGWSPSMEALPELEHRKFRSSANQRYGTAITESLFMSSRDGVTFKRWDEAFLRPGPERPDTWNYGHQTLGWHLVETRSALAGAPNELSLYAIESYWTDNSCLLRRYTLRLDGFVSVSAPMSGGELVTKPLRFRGTKLVLNFSSSAAGEVRVEIQDASGSPIPGRALEDCPPIFGDAIERPVTWENGSDLSALSRRAVRLRFVLKDADIFAFQFKN